MNLRNLLILVNLLISYALYAQTLTFWGMTMSGGVNNGGTIFSTDANGDNHSLKYSFSFNDGSEPEGALLENNGKLYGITNYGGNVSYEPRGVLFEYDPVTAIYTKKYNFDEAIIGYDFIGGLVEAGNGK
ncbi:MAG: hypothetical protein GY810_07965 [Aureispira sp.]|nr:hypothetical protein [Aureispira sp.]